MSRICIVGVATRLRTERYGVRFLAGASDFSSRQNVHTASTAHQASYSVGTGVHFRGVKWPGREVNHSSPPSAEVKSEWSYASIPSIRLHGVGRDNFCFIIIVAFITATWALY